MMLVVVLVGVAGVHLVEQVIDGRWDGEGSPDPGAVLLLLRWPKDTSRGVCRAKCFFWQSLKLSLKDGRFTKDSLNLGESTRPM